MSKTGKRELCRDPENGKIAGVCAGIAEYFGWEVWLVRIITVSGFILANGLFFVGYIAAWFILDKKQPSGFGRSRTKRFRRDTADSPVEVKSKVWQAGEPPRKAFHDIDRQFNALENRLRKMEGYVTSAEFTVSREINRL